MPTIKIHEYMANSAGARNLGFDAADGVHVLIQPSSAEHQKRAQQVAVAFADAALEQQAQQLALDGLQAANETLSNSARRGRASLSSSALRWRPSPTGRRRFFGPVLMKPARPGEWDGEVWLLDPEKRERGFSLRFESLAEVRQLHPELWVVGVVDGGVLLDAFRCA